MTWSLESAKAIITAEKCHIAAGGQGDIIWCDINVIPVHGSHFVGEGRSHGSFTQGIRVQAYRF